MIFMCFILVRDKIRENSHSWCIAATDNLTSMLYSTYILEL